MPESTQILSYNSEYTLSSILFSNIDSDKIIKSGKLYVKLTDYIGIVSANRLKLYFKNSSNVYSIVDASNYFEKNNEYWVYFDIAHSFFDFEYLESGGSYVIKNENAGSIEVFTGSSLHLDVEYYNEYDSDSRNVINVEIPDYSLAFNHQTQCLLLKRDFYNGQLAYDLSLVYSSKLKNETAYLFPKGWKLNLLDYLLITRTSGVITAITFVDKNNTEHNLVPLTGITDEWYTNDGSALILRVNTDGSTTTFELLNELSSARKIFDSDGKLVSYTNEDGKTISVSHSTRSILITDYNNNQILVQGSKGGFSISLNGAQTFNFLALLSVLSTISYDDNAYSESFTYDNDGNLSSVTSFDSHIINISYSNRRVSSINKYFSMFKEEEYSLSYKFLRTVITNISGVQTYFFYNIDLSVGSTGEVDNNIDALSTVSSKSLIDGDYVFVSGSPKQRVYRGDNGITLNSSSNSYQEVVLTQYANANGFGDMTLNKRYLLIATIDKANYISLGDYRQIKIQIGYRDGMSYYYSDSQLFNCVFNLDKQTIAYAFSSPTTEGNYVDRQIVVKIIAQGFGDFGGVTFSNICILEITGSRTRYYSDNSYTSQPLPLPFPPSPSLTLDNKSWYIFSSMFDFNSLKKYSYKDLVRNYLNIEKGNQYFWDDDLHHLTYNPYPNNDSTNGGYYLHWHRNIQGSNSIYAKRTILKQYLDSNDNLKEIASFEYLESFIDNNELFFRLTTIKQVGDDIYKSTSVYDDNFKLIREEKDTEEEFTDYIYDSNNNLVKIESGSTNSSYTNRIYRQEYDYDANDRLTEEHSLSSNNIENRETSYVGQYQLVSSVTDEANNQETYLYDNYYRYLKKISKGTSEINRLYVDESTIDISNGTIFRSQRMVNSSADLHLLKFKSSSTNYTVIANSSKSTYYDESPQTHSPLEVQRYNFKYYYDKYNHLTKLSKVGNFGSTTLLSKFYYFDARPDDIEDTSVTTFTDNKTTSKAKLYRIDDSDSSFSFFDYNSEGKLIQKKIQISSSNIYQFDYEYDYVDRVINYTFTVGGFSISTDVEYQNSNSNRVIEIKHNYDSDSFVQENYYYDKLSRKKTTITRDSENSLYPNKKEYIYYSKDLTENNETIHLESSLIKRIDYFKTIVVPPGLPEYTLDYSSHISYDSKGNVTSIKRGTQTTPNTSTGVNYEYDVNNRLTKEDNYDLTETIRYYYDNNGNITSVTHSDLNSSVVNSTNSYSYNNKYKDLLVSINGKSLTYDDYFNPLTFGTKSFSWIGNRWLSSITDSSNNLNVGYSYNSNGVRTKKQLYNPLIPSIVDRTHQYYLDGNRIIREKIDELSPFGLHTSLTYLYSSEGIIGFIKDNVFYRYEKNILGDIIAIYQGNTLVAKYIYDAYGNHHVYNSSDQEITYSSNPTHIGILNPFRYRSYYYDSESDLYYCNSRYYSPELRRWLNIDDVSYFDSENIDGINLFAYCLNNPVMNVDPDGNSIIATIVAIAILGCIGAATNFAAQTVTDLIFGQGFDWGRSGIAALAGFIGGMAMAIPVVGMIVSSGLTSGLNTIGQMAYSSNEYDARDYVLGFALSMAAGCAFSAIMSRVLSNVPFFVDLEFLQSSYVELFTSYSSTRLSKSFLALLSGYLFAKSIASELFSSVISMPLYWTIDYFMNNHFYRKNTKKLFITWWEYF